MTVKRALLVGIDDYDNFNSLGGCVNDVEALTPLLTRHDDNSPNFQCQTRTSRHGDVSRDALLDDIETLLSGPADVALLYYAGHGDGTAVGDDVTLVTRDGTAATPGIAISELMSKVLASPVREIVLILDCCFAGGAGGVPAIGLPGAVLRDGASILAASRADQTSAETTRGRGAFSEFLCAGLDGGAADTLGKVSVAGIYAYIDEAFDAWGQRPTFKANLGRLEPLRVCEPPVPLPELRRLPELFGSVDFELPLDPSFEPTEEPEHPENEATLAVLQHLRAARLIEPVDADHMYFAAMEEKACRLTALGRLYWEMATKDRI
jgi:hypothetical protein